jgi:CheY-like chemotaxis protein
MIRRGPSRSQGRGQSYQKSALELFEREHKLHGFPLVCVKRKPVERPLIVITNADRTFLQMMSDLLIGEGYEVIISEESQATFEVIKRRLPALVIIELLILDPEVGLMILDKMRLQPDTSRIPVIIAPTATQLLRDNEEHLRVKGCDILQKPFESRRTPSNGWEGCSTTGATEVASLERRWTRHSESMVVGVAVPQPCGQPDAPRGPQGTTTADTCQILSCALGAIHDN